jgi:hypothetical protein
MGARNHPNFRDILIGEENRREKVACPFMLS